jgi:hypothetical protein
MKKIKLFLAATEDALAEDRMAVADLINQLNDKYEDKGIYFQLLKPRGAPQLETFADCEMVFIIWFNRSDDIMDGSFEAALKQFQTKGKPKIVTYFRQVSETANPTTISIADDVAGFMRRLDQELGHYYNIYSHIDSLRFSLLMQIGVLEQEISLECCNGQILVGGDKFMSIYDIPCGAGNKSLQVMQQDFKQLTARFYELRELHADNEGDQAIADDFMAVADKRNELRESISNIERSILSAAMSMADNVAAGCLSQRQKEAYRLFEQGDYEGANAILDFTEIKSDIASAELAAEIVSDKLKLHVNELLQKFDLLKTNVMWTDVYQASLQCLREAVRVEEKHNLPKRAMLILVEWLLDHHEIKESFKIGERLFFHMQLEDNPDMIRVRMLRYKLAQVCYLMNRLDEALDHLAAIEIYYTNDNQLITDAREKNLHILTITLMGEIYLRVPGQEEQLYSIVEDIESYYLSDNFADDFEADYFETFHNFVSLHSKAYKKIGRLARALTFARFELEILESIESEVSKDLKTEHASKILETLLLISELHFDSGNVSKAVEIVEDCWEDKMDFILEDSNRYADCSLKAYVLRARYYSLIRAFSEADFYLDDAIDYAKYLYTKSPETYLVDYVKTKICLIEANHNLGYQLDLSELELTLKMIDNLLMPDSEQADNTAFIETALTISQILLERQMYILTPQNVDQFIQESTILEEYWNRVFVEMEKNAIGDITIMLCVLDQILRFYIIKMQRGTSEIEVVGQMISQAKIAIDQCLEYPEQGGGDFSGLLKRYRPTYHIAASMYYRLINENQLAKDTAIEGLYLVQDRNEGKVERECIYDFAMLQVQWAEAEYNLENINEAISCYAVAISALTAINEASSWKNLPDIHTLMTCYHEYMKLAIENQNYEEAADHLDIAFDVIVRILFSESFNKREYAYCLLVWDYAKLVIQLTGIVNSDYAVNFIADAIERLEKQCTDETALTAHHKSLLLLKLQRAYICSGEDLVDEAAASWPDVTSICEQHLSNVCLTDQDIDEWWSYYDQALGLPDLS